MDQHQREWNEKVAARIIKNLEKRRMTGSYAVDVAQAKTEIVDMIPQGATVFRCGSMTSVGLGLWEAIAALPEVKVIDPVPRRIVGGGRPGTQAPGSDRRCYDCQHQRDYPGRTFGQS